MPRGSHGDIDDKIAPGKQLYELTDALTFTSGYLVQSDSFPGSPLFQEIPLHAAAIRAVNSCNLH